MNKIPFFNLVHLTRNTELLTLVKQVLGEKDSDPSYFLNDDDVKAIRSEFENKKNFIKTATTIQLEPYVNVFDNYINISGSKKNSTTHLYALRLEASASVLEAEKLFNEVVEILIFCKK